MASAYSILHNYDQELYSPNLNLIGTALQYKQGTYNANKAKLQTLWDKFSFLDVAKEQDQEYLEGRLQAVHEVMDKYTMLDLSSNNLTSQLVSNMSQVVDDNVMNAVYSTRVYKGEQAAWSQLKQNKPEKYSEVNHAYASRASQAWLNDGQTGSKYNGGGGVIEYVDVQGKLASKIPEIAKNIKAEWVELASGGGYFRDQVSKERVSRDKLSAAMDGILNQQDRRQMSINAWGMFDNMSDQQLEAAYTNHFAPKIQNIQNQITSLERTVNSTKDPEMKAYRNNLLDFYKAQLESYEANSFSNMINTYGREATYNTLYDNQFRGNYLDTYSYSDRITKIATYDNDVKQRNYEFKLSELQFRKDNAAFNQAVKLREVGYTAPLQGTEAVIGLPESTMSKIQAYQDKQQSITDNVKNLFDIQDDRQLRQLSEVFAKGFAGKEYVEFNGQRIKVLDNLDLLLEYQNNILNQSPIEKEALANFNKAVSTSLGTLRELTLGDNPDWVAGDSVPKFNFAFKFDKETGIMQKISVPKDSNPYAYLLGKEDLTEDEKYTLDIYHRMHLLMDPEIGDSEKALIFKDLQTDKFSKLSNEDYNSFPYDVHAYNRMSTRRGTPSAGGATLAIGTEVFQEMQKEGLIDKYSDLIKADYLIGSVRITTYGGYKDILTDLGNTYKAYMDAFDEGKKKYRDKINSLTEILDSDKAMMTTNKNHPVYAPDYYISDITAADAEYYNKDGKEVSLKAPSKIIKEGVTLYANTLENAYKTMDKEPSLYPQIFNTSTSGYSNLATLVGLPANSKVPITLQRVWDKDKKTPTGEVMWHYKTGTGENIKTFTSEEGEGLRLTVDQLRSNGIINFGASAQVKYDASWGNNAPKLDLGNNQYDDRIKKNNVLMYGGPLAMSLEEVKPLFDDAYKFGGPALVEEFNNYRKAFIAGKYEFKMEAIDGAWQYAMYDSTGNRLYSMYTEDSIVDTYTDQEVKNIFVNSEKIINDVMYNYLFSKMEEKAADYILSHRDTQ